MCSCLLRQHCIIFIHGHVYWDTLYLLYKWSCLLRHPVWVIHVIMFIRTPCIRHNMCSCLLRHPVSAIDVIMFIGTPCISHTCCHVYWEPCISHTCGNVHWDTLHQPYIRSFLLGHPVSAIHVVMLIENPVSAIHVVMFIENPVSSIHMVM